MAKSKKAAKAKAPKSPAGNVRGAALAELVIAKLVADGVIDDPRPLAPKALAALALPGGRPLPPSLARLLAIDADHLHVLDARDRLQITTFPAMVEREYGEEWVKSFTVAAKLLTAPCLVVPGGGNSRRFVYFGEPDAHGEYPVFVLDNDGGAFVCVAYPGLDVYLADGTVADIIKGNYADGFKHRAYKDALIEQARRNFHGLEWMSDFRAEHVDGAAAAKKVMATVQ